MASKKTITTFAAGAAVGGLVTYLWLTGKLNFAPFAMRRNTF